MVKKKISGQTIAILVLLVLLIATTAFGVVFAFYSTSTKQVSGTISMAYLDIHYDESTLGVGSSGQSQILITNSENIVPNELLGNSPLVINSTSNTETYIVVLYRVEKVGYDGTQPRLDSIYHYNDVNGNEYFDYGIDTIKESNGVKSTFGVLDIGTAAPTSNWADFIFDTANYPEYQTDGTPDNDERYAVRCFITKQPIAATFDKNQPVPVTVIAANNLRLHPTMGNEFKGKAISFTFQAHAIGADTFQFTDGMTQDQKSEQIVKSIYFQNGFKFSV